MIRNNTLGQIKWEQMMVPGNPEYECDLQPIDFAGVAEAHGAERVSSGRAADPSLPRRATVANHAAILTNGVNIT